MIDCTIDNQSDGGAHIRLQNSHGLPEDFYLVEANRGIIHKAEVAWRTTTGMGLRILGPHRGRIGARGAAPQVQAQRLLGA